ncbi:hypothetical protein ACFOVU_16530 [Nocardiopsis sediminis]|uniref:ARB-07466-like C-terminal domain-containing protein n=1 Tax=Nocardiopsis sediminis TaxID=1778267 RepID=A0ABV8FRP3_9ACTN
MSALTGRIRRLAVAVAAVIVLAAGAYLVLSRSLSGTGTEPERAVARPDPPCSVHIGTGEDGASVGLSVEDARRATTAVALEAAGGKGPDTSGIDPAVLERLREGPPEDAGPSLTCRAATTEGLESEEFSASGLTPRAEAVLTAVTDTFGEQSVGGFQPGGLTSGHGTDSAHYLGAAVDVFFRPVSEENRRQGWLLAHWLVAHAEQFHLANIIFDDRIWSISDSQGGWARYQPPSIGVDPDNEILRHVDHVHVDVQLGEKGDP